MKPPTCTKRFYAKHITIILLGMSPAISAHAAFKCLGADGRVEYSDRPCEPAKSTLAKPRTTSASTSDVPLNPMAQLEKLFFDFSPRLCEREKLTDELATASRSGEIAKFPAAWRVKQDRQTELNEVRINFQQRAGKITATAGSDSKESIALRRFQQSLKNCDPTKPFVITPPAVTSVAPAATPQTPPLKK